MIRAPIRVAVFGLLMSLFPNAATGWTPEDGDARRARVESLVLAADAELPDAVRRAKHADMTATRHGFVRATALLFHRDIDERESLAVLEGAPAVADHLRTVVVADDRAVRRQANRDRLGKRDRRNVRVARREPAKQALDHVVGREARHHERRDRRPAPRR